MTTAGDNRDIDKLLARIESLEQSGKQALPFWRNTAAVGILGGVIAVVPASLTAIHGYYQTQREVALSVAEYNHQRTVSYLEQALSPDATEADQAKVLRFLAALPEGGDNDALRKWADAELEIVKQRIEDLRQLTRTKIENNEKLAKKAEVEQAKLEQIQVEVDAGGDADPGTLAAYQVQADTVSELKQQIERNAAEAKVAAARTADPELEQKAASLEVPPAPKSKSGDWRIRIATNRDEAEINRLSMMAVATASSMGRTVKPEIYRRGERYFLFVGNYSSRSDAAADEGEMKRLIKQGAWTQNIDEFCPDAEKQRGYWQCGSRP